MSTQNVPGQDGTLADDLRTDFFQLKHSDSTPTAYRGVDHGIITRTPGTYYWQAYVTYYASGIGYVSQMSPVFTWIVAAPPPPPPPPPPRRVRD